MIRLDRVSKRYPGGHEALTELSLEIPRGSFTFITGHSGAGKSTLLKLIALLERPTRGQVLVDGCNIARLPRRRIPAHRRRIGMIFQDHRLLHDRTVFDNVALPLVIAGADPREIPRRVRAALDRVGLLGQERARPITLSSGEQQRVGIARAVVNRPDLLLADEPTGNLDPDLSREIMHLFERFHARGTTILIATHDLALVRELRHPVIRLQHGRLVERDAA
ncbi:MAG: cell division ATP-binding protein FtsE [Gammaproteobacteria bacterium]|nr:MAG: cell division ATP-binding protein FtsE [Gammaproteobacteria bacterium]